MVEKLLKVRAAAKKRKPTYKRVQSHQFAKFREEKWRRPKGLGNKVRRGRRGKPSMPEVGFGSPKEVKGLNKKGLREVIVSNVKDLEKINPKTDAVMLSRNLGDRKKLEVLKKAKEMKLTVSNVKDVEAKIKSLTKEKKTVKKSEAKSEEKSQAKTEVKAEAKDAKAETKKGGKKE